MKYYPHKKIYKSFKKYNIYKEKKFVGTHKKNQQ